MSPWARALGCEQLEAAAVALRVGLGPALVVSAVNLSWVPSLLQKRPLEEHGSRASVEQAHRLELAP